jgi:hypothetical protein
VDAREIDSRIAHGATLTIARVCWDGSRGYLLVITGEIDDSLVVWRRRLARSHKPVVKLGRVDRSSCAPGVHGVLALCTERLLVVTILDNHHPPRAFALWAGVVIGKCVCLFLRIPRGLHFEELKPIIIIVIIKDFAASLVANKLLDVGVVSPTAPARFKLRVCR